MCLDLLAVLIKFSLSVEHFIHQRMYNGRPGLFLFLLKTLLVRTKKNDNNTAGFKSASQLSLKTKEKTIASAKHFFIDDSQFLLINANGHLQGRKMFGKI